MSIYVSALEAAAVPLASNRKLVEEVESMSPIMKGHARGGVTWCGGRAGNSLAMYIRARRTEYALLPAWLPPG